MASSTKMTFEGKGTQLDVWNMSNLGCTASGSYTVKPWTLTCLTLP